MRVYFAADFARAVEVEELAQHCADVAAIEVTSRWHALVASSEAETATVIGGPPDPAVARLAAERNLSDLDDADVVVLVTTGSLARGGRHFESGYAYATGKAVVVAGPVEHAFHRLPGIAHSTLDVLPRLLAEWRTDPESTDVALRGARAGDAARRCVQAQGFTVPASPTLDVEDRLHTLWPRLLDEELGELRTALQQRDLVAVADALADIAYVALSAGATYGIPMDAVFDEVHRSNMSKVAAGGDVITREDGKILKPDTFSPPDIEAILASATRPSDE